MIELLFASLPEYALGQCINKSSLQYDYGDNPKDNTSRRILCHNLNYESSFH